MDKLIVITTEELKFLLKECIREELKALNTAPPEQKPPATKREVAAHLGISMPTLDALIKSGQIPAFNIGRGIRFRWDDIEEYVNTKRIGRHLSDKITSVKDTPDLKVNSFGLPYIEELIKSNYTKPAYKKLLQLKSHVNSFSYYDLIRFLSDELSIEKGEIEKSLFDGNLPDFDLELCVSKLLTIKEVKQYFDIHFLSAKLICFKHIGFNIDEFRANEQVNKKIKRQIDNLKAEQRQYGEGWEGQPTIEYSFIMRKEVIEPIFHNYKIDAQQNQPQSEIRQKKVNGDFVTVGKMVGLTPANALAAFKRENSKHHKTVVNALAKIIQTRDLLIK